MSSFLKKKNKSVVEQVGFSKCNLVFWVGVVIIICYVQSFYEIRFEFLYISTYFKTGCCFFSNSQGAADQASRDAVSATAAAAAALCFSMTIYTEI